MQYDFGVVDVLPEEWERFTRSLDDLSDGAQRRARQAAARFGPSDPTTVTIAVPGWDDVLRVRPRPAITPDEKQLHYEALKAGRPSPLAPELQAELARRRDRYRLMQTSAQPEYSKAAGGVMTAIDNVQDLLGTVAVLGRLAVVPPLRALAQIGAAEAPFVSRAARFALPIFGRVLPVVGLILTAADLLRVLNLLASALFPWYAAACALSKDQLQAGIPAILPGRASKRLVENFARTNVLGRKAQLKTSATTKGWAIGAEARRQIPTGRGIAGFLRERVETGKIRPRWYEIIEGAQTAEVLFGRGLILGGVVGLVQDTVFATEQAARGKRVVITSQPLPEPMMRDYAESVTGVPTAALHDLRTAANVLAAGPVVQRTQENFTFDEHLEFLAAYSAALGLLRPWIDDPRLEPLVDAALVTPLAPAEYRADEFADEMELAGAGRPDRGIWALPGNPERVTGFELAVGTMEEIPVALWQLIAPRRDTVEGAFVSALAERIMERWAILYSGGIENVDEELPREFQVMVSLVESRRWVNTAEPDERILRFFQLAAAELERAGTRFLGPRELDRLERDAGITLIRMLGPEAPMPTPQGAASP